MLLTAGILFLITVSGVYGAKLNVAEADYTNEESELCIKEYSCVNCTTVRLCLKKWNGTLTKITEFNCSSSFPYCHALSGTCQNYTRNDTCAQDDPNFLCSNDGNFPHPTDCHKYYTCVKGRAFLYDCGTDSYDLKSETCLSSESCNYIDCVSKSGVKVYHPSDSSYFGYCYNGTVFRVDKCPGRFKLDVDSQVCVPRCEEEGRQGDPYDCTRYYKCYYESSSTYVLTLEHLQCPENELYDALNFHCTPKKVGLTCESGSVYLGNGKFL